MDPIQLSAGAAAIIPVIMVLVSLSKNYVDSKWSPLVALVLSVGASFLLASTGDVTGNITQGILMTLAAAGLYSSGKTTINAVKG